MRQFCKSLFPVVEYAYCTIPTYPSGQIGFMLCSKNPVSFRHLKCPFALPEDTAELASAWGLLGFLWSQVCQLRAPEVQCSLFSRVHSWPVT